MMPNMGPVHPAQFEALPPVSANAQMKTALDQHKAHTQAEINATYHEIAGLTLQQQLLSHQLGDVEMLIDTKRAQVKKLIADHNVYRKALGEAEWEPEDQS